MALDLIAKELGVTSIIVRTSDRQLAATIISWGRNHQLAVSWQRSTATDANTSAPSARTSLRAQIVRFLPPIGALTLLLRLRKVKANVQAGRPDSGEQASIMIDYLAHLSVSANDGNQFASNYWGALVRAVEQRRPMTWLHMSPTRPTAASVAREQAVIESWEESSGVQHALLQSGISSAIKWRSLRDYVTVALKGLLIRRKKHLFRDETAGLPLWSTFKHEFRNDWYGSSAMMNALYLNLFEEYLARSPRADFGVYLFENQPWEAALIYAWRNSGHGLLIGFAHSTILYWDTRIFQAPSDLPFSQAECDHTWPDRIAVTGSGMSRLLLQGGFPSQVLADVEPVRFTQSQTTAATENSDRTRILLLGEYSWDATERMLNVVKPVLTDHASSYAVRLRLHPACSPQWSAPPGWLEVDKTHSMAEALDRSDIVISGPLTSAAVESVYQGLPTLIAADPSLLPGSPAQGLGATHVYSFQGLAAALKSISSSKERSPEHINADGASSTSKLEGWRKLLHLPE